MTSKWCGIGANILFGTCDSVLSICFVRKQSAAHFLVYAMEDSTLITERARRATETLRDSCVENAFAHHKRFIIIWISFRHGVSRSRWWTPHSHLVPPSRANMYTAMLQTLKAKPTHHSTACQWSLRRLSNNSLVKKYLDYLDVQRLLKTF